MVNDPRRTLMMESSAPAARQRRRDVRGGRLALGVLVLLLTWSLFCGWLSPAASAVEAAATIAGDKLLYHPGEDVNFHFSFNPVREGLAGNLVLRIYPAASPSAEGAFSGEPLFEVGIKNDFQLTGPEAIDYNAPLSDLGLGLGGYPVKLSLMADGEELLAATTWLAVTDAGEANPLDLVLIWALGSPPEKNPAGQFEDAALLNRCLADTKAPDGLLTHRALAEKFPQLKTVYAIEPALLDQLSDLADGFEFADGDEIKDFPAGSPEAGVAGACLDSLKQLAAAGNVEILGSPYAFTNLPLLAKGGWEDGSAQFRLGRDVLGELLALAATPRGVYLPGLDLTTDSLRYPAVTGGEYTVLAGSLRAFVQGRLLDSVSFRLRDMAGERITTFFAADDASAALLGERPDAAAFFAALANNRAAATTSELMIAAAPVPLPRLSSAQREQVYGVLAQEPWIKSITLAEAKQKYRPSTDPASLERYFDLATGYLAQTYYQKLESTHELFASYKAAMDSDRPEMVNISKKMFVAESEYWAGERVRPEDANRGLGYLEEISNFIAEELDRVRIKVDTPLLQGAYDGEATISILNGNLYPLTVDLVLGGSGFELPEGSEQRLQLETGITEIKVPFHAQGGTKLQAQVKSQGHLIVEDSAAVRPLTGRLLLFALLIVAIPLASIGYYLFAIKGWPRSRG